MAGHPARKKGKKNRKWGRFKLKCAAYRNERRREKNKKRKLSKHLRKHGADKQAAHAFSQIKL